jgi:hypothetical protein
MAGSPVVSGEALVPADAAPPSWQPWVAVQNNALSRLKTQLQTSLRLLDQEITEASKLLDGARMLAAQQVAHLESAAWAAWNKYMAEAASIEKAVMDPALKAHADQLAAAVARFKADVYPVEHAYSAAKTQAQYGQNLVQ